MKLITIEKEYDMLLKNNITEFLSPNHIYLPISKENKIFADPSKYIYKRSLLYDKVYSPISGKILGVKKIENKSYMVIENDFKEKVETKNKIRRDITKLTKEELLNLIKDYDENIYNEFNCENKKIIINGIEEHPYIGNISYIITNNSKDLLEVIDNIARILNVKSIEFNLKETDFRSINYINNIIGSYPNIRINFLPDKYLIGYKEIYKKYYNVKEDFIYIGVEELFNLFEFLERKKKNETKLITITGNAITNPQVINCKIGSNLKDIIEELIEVIDDNNVIFINSLLNNNIISSKDYIITKEVKAIFIMKKIDIKEEKCINCGMCNEVCPQKINVYNLINNKKSDTKNCIKCGLCSYICPSFININKYLDGDQNE